MHVRMLQLTAKPGQVKELAQKLNDRALPLLKQQPGFIHALALTSNSDRDQFLGVTIWKTEQDANNWVNGKAREVIDSVAKPLIRQEPTIKSFTVEASTLEEIGMGRAAGNT
jgi:heme-degrading monooxygenase HmoA